MIWNRDITQAPKGQIVKRSVVTTKGDKSYDSFEPDYVILASKCGKVGKSYWLPMEDRWAGYQKGEEVTAWMPWPTHPNELETATKSGADTDPGKTAAEGICEAVTAGETATHFITDDCGSGA